MRRTPWALWGALLGVLIFLAVDHLTTSPEAFVLGAVLSLAGLALLVAAWGYDGA